MLKKLLYPIFKRLYNIDSLVPKRFKFGLSTFLYLSSGLFYILVYAPNISFKVSTLFAVISCILFIYPLIFGLVRGYDFSKILPVPIIFIFSSFFILNYFPNLNTYFKISFLLFSSLIYYFLLLSLNVFLVVQEKGSKIPLLRPAKTTFLLVEVISIFLFTTNVYKFILPDPFTEVTFILQIFLCFLVSYFFATQYWWSQDLEQDITNFVGNESITIAFCVSVIAASMSFFSTESFFRGLAISSVYYISISFFQSIVTHKFVKSQFIEYIFISFVVLFFLLLA